MSYQADVCFVFDVKGAPLHLPGVPHHYYADLMDPHYQTVKNMTTNTVLINEDPADRNLPVEAEVGALLTNFVNEYNLLFAGEKQLFQFEQVCKRWEWIRGRFEVRYCYRAELHVPPGTRVIPPVHTPPPDLFMLLAVTCSRPMEATP